MNSMREDASSKTSSPAPLIRAADVKAKRAAENKGKASKRSKKKTRSAGNPYKNTNAAKETKPAASTAVKAADYEPAKVQPAKKSDKTAVRQISEEKRREILEEAMERPEIYETDSSMFVGTEAVTEAISDGNTQDDTNTYETNNEENESVKKKFRSQSTVKAQRRKTAAVITVIASAAVIFGGTAAYAGSYSRIYPNISIMGEDFGGLTREEAVSRLYGKYGEPALKNIKVSCENSSIEVDPSALNAVFQLEETADYAYRLGRSGGVFEKIRNAVFKKHPAEDVPLMVSLDDEALRDMIDGLVSPYESYSADRYEIGENEITFIKGEKGLYVDRDEAAGKVKGEIAELRFSPVVLTPQLSEPIELVPEEVYSEITAEPAAPFYAREGDQIIVKDGKPQVEIEKSDVEHAIKDLKKNGTVSVECKTQAVGPSADELRGKLFRDTLGSYKSSFSAANTARSSNVRLAADRINGTVLLPGETFSYDKTIGRRTVENGYKEANVYTNNKVDVGVGGGICQTSSTLYSAVLYANLEIVSRTSHSLPVSYVPAGQDATIAEGSIDFNFRNNTDYPVKIVANASSSNVTCSIVGTNDDGVSVKLNHEITDKQEDGSFSVVSHRIVYKNGKEIKREKLRGSHYNAIQPDPTPSPSPSPSVSPAPSESPSAESTPSALPEDNE